MKIYNDLKIVKGEHKHMRFQLENGRLRVNGIIFTKQCIQELVELANLLELEGHKLQERPQFQPFTIEEKDALKMMDYTDAEIEEIESQEREAFEKRHGQTPKSED